MAPPNTRKTLPSPSVKGSSPALKKMKTTNMASSNNKTTSSETAEFDSPVNADAAGARRSLDSEFDSQPPLWFKTYMEDFKSNLDKLVSKKLKEQDEKIESIQFDMRSACVNIANFEMYTKSLESKTDDLENRSRRNNLVLYGVPESQSGSENCKEMVTSLLTDFVGIDGDLVKNSLQRCHRTPTYLSQAQSTDRNAKPRMIHLNLASFLDKEQVRKACIAKFKQDTFHGKKIYVAEDLSKKVQLERKAKLDVFKKLQKEGQKPFFAYPAVIRYRTPNGVVTVA